MTLLLVITFFLVYTGSLALYLSNNNNITAQNKVISLGAVCTFQPPNNQTVLGASNCQNLEYRGLMGIGTPPQNFTMTFDTGSNILWIPTTACTGCSNKQFAPQNSSTYQNSATPMQIQYADGSGVQGFYGSDVVTFSGTSISVNTGILWVSQQVNMNSLTSNGLVGLGYDPSVNNFFDSAYQAGQIASNVFAVGLKSEPTQSFLYYNILPEFIVSSTKYVDQFRSGHWQAETIGFYAGGVDLTDYAGDASIIDSGTSLFYFNSNLYTEIVSRFFSQCTLSANNITCPCNTTFPIFTFYFVGIKTYLYPENYTSNCSALFGNTGSNTGSILLGDTYMRNYIVTYDKSNSRIGFSGNLELVYLIGQGATDFLYISQIVGFAMALFLLLALIVVCVFVNKRAKLPEKPINTFLLQVT